MNRAVKMSMIGLGIVAALVALALVVFLSTFDINNYKERITKAVLDETGRTLIFEGDMRLDLFPRLGIEFGGVSLSNAAGFGENPMVQAKSARVSVRVLPLLKGDVKFGFLEIDGLMLNLSRNHNGVSNWDDLVGRKPEKKQSLQQNDTKQFSLEIEGVDIKDAALSWDDRVADSSFLLNGVNLVTGQIFKGAPFPVDANFSFDCTKPQVVGTLTLSGKASIDLDNREYGYMDMKLSLAAEGEAIPGGKGAAEMAIQFGVLDFKKEHAQITGLTATAYGATMHMDGTFEGITEGLKKVVATVTLDAFDAKQSMAALGLDVPVTADDAALTSVGGMAELVYSPGELVVKTVQADLDGNRITGNARFTDDVDEPLYFARLDMGTLDLDRYLPPDDIEQKHESKQPVASDGQSDRLIDSEMIRQLYLDIEAKGAAVRIKGIWLENVNAVIKARRGLLRISPLSAGLYDGSLSAGVTVNATNKYPGIDIIAGLDKVDIGKLSKDALGKQSYAGILNFNSALSCDGERVPAMLRSMNGKVGFHLSDGVFPGVDLMHMAKATHASKDSKEGTVEASETDATRFGSISGTGVITAGILRNRDLEVKAPGLRADGQGTVVLSTRQLDYLVKVKLVPTAEGQGGKDSSDLYGVMVPIRVAGTIDHPRYWVSVTEYVKALGGAVIGTAGSVLGGVRDAVKGVGNALTGGKDSDTKEDGEPKKKRGLFGIF